VFAWRSCHGPLLAILRDNNRDDNLDRLRRAGENEFACAVHGTTRKADPHTAVTLRNREMPEQNRWYVSYTVRSDEGPRRYARRTRTFETEDHAKVFARERAANDLRLTAGTINPHSPKRVISTTEIATWLGTPAPFPGSCRATGQARAEKRP
jgi:hypothetical protein